MLIGYARVSTRDQEAGFEAQLRDLRAHGCEEVYEERGASGKDAERPELQALLSYVRRGDTVAVTRLDRLARSTKDLLEIAERLKAKGAGLVVLDMPGLDTTTATGALLITVIGAISTFERELMLERQSEGIAQGKKDGKYRGRAPTARNRTAEIVAAYKANPKPAEIARTLKIGRTSVYRALWAEGLLERPSAA